LSNVKRLACRYLERAANTLRSNGHAVDEALLQYLSPLGWEHINLTGDYFWRSSAKGVRGNSGRDVSSLRPSVVFFPFSEAIGLSAQPRQQAGAVHQ